MKLCVAYSSRCIKRNYYLGDDEHLNRLASHIKEVLSIRDGRGFSNAEIKYIVKSMYMLTIILLYRYACICVYVYEGVYVCKWKGMFMCVYICVYQSDA